MRIGRLRTRQMSLRHWRTNAAIRFLRPGFLTSARSSFARIARRGLNSRKGSGSGKIHAAEFVSRTRGTKGGRHMTPSMDEQRLRIDLAACYRLVALHGWDDLVFTHISVKLPGNAGF